jgi:hypothetical protein
LAFLQQGKEPILPKRRNEREPKAVRGHMTQAANELSECPRFD